MSLSDIELRNELVKYMDSVPPVTGSTRQVLEAKLAKFKAANEKVPFPNEGPFTRESITFETPNHCDLVDID